MKICLWSLKLFVVSLGTSSSGLESRGTAIGVGVEWCSFESFFVNGEDSLRFFILFMWLSEFIATGVSGEFSWRSDDLLENGVKFLFWRKFTSSKFELCFSVSIVSKHSSFEDLTFKLTWFLKKLIRLELLLSKLGQKNHHKLIAIDTNVHW